MTKTDAAKLPVMLTSLRLPTIARLWQDLGARADREGWGAARYLATLCEHEVQERHTRRIARHLAEADLPTGKTLQSFEFASVPSLRKAHVLALAGGDAWLDQGANILLFGPSGTGKSHLAAAIGTALVENGHRVLFTRTTDLVQRLQAARRDLALPGLLAKLDRYDCLILDDLGYVRKDQAETSVLFELIAERYERRSLIATCNQPFSAWDQIFPDPAMTVAAIDRLVHHATILELNTESYRRRAAARAGAEASTVA
ncbi:IS21-like element helper ATPase IstB [Methylobacterium brachiatum]|jgi:DNA replication protein DnaC|uniref:IS21-like element helper ATPase IstB n=1 Tax=Methylobacterium TaxID=407 RepID=UPI000EFCB86E|nr:cell division protein ZapE [Methylobacterium brachiatum]